MEVYRTEDGQVSKYIHDDGSETAIKTVSSCANEVNKINGDVIPIDMERNKFSVFVSSSVGCPIGCKFCYLTVKKFPYHKLKPREIFNNVAEALSEEIKFKPELRKKYMKLSWMGMGDAFLMDPRDLCNITSDILEWSIGSKNFAHGLDGIDISTVMPRENTGWPHAIAKLNDEFYSRFKRNPSSKDRSVVRLFYSLHSMMDRPSLIPINRFNVPVCDISLLAKVREWYGIDVILHHMFLEGINDDDRTLKQIHVLVNNILKDAEVRILRFNECKNSPFKESKNFDELVRKYAQELPRIKYQISAGSEIKAACGQFLCLTNAES